MSEEPKNFWKKSWTGWGRLWAWLILVVATFFIVLIISLLIPGGARNLPGGVAPGFALVVGVIAGVSVGLVGCIRWVVHWHNFKRFLFGLACLVTLVALFYAEEDWRGWHDWNQFKHEWEAKGEEFSWRSVVPPPVPNDQNFAFSPVWIAVERFQFLNEPKRAEAWYGNRIYGKEVSKFLPFLPVSVTGLVGTNWANRWVPETPKMPGQWPKARLADLKPWQSYYRGFEKTNPAADIPITPQPQSPAQDVLLALSKFDPVIEQLKADSARPYSRFPLGYDNEDKAAILLPHLAALKRFAMVLQLRALAELQNGQSEKALSDVKLMMRLTDAIRSEPFIISQLVRFADFQITLQPIYEGLAEHKWSDAQLADLGSELSKLDFLAGYELSVRGERNAHINIIDWLKQKRSHSEELFNMGLGDNHESEFLLAAVFYLMPKGWYYQNDIMLAQEAQQWALPVVNDANQTVSPQKANQANQAVGLISRHLTPFNFLALQLLPAVGAFAIRTAHTQASADLARVAIALERYRLAHGGYPKSLDALAPQFIAKVPHDVIGGGPLHYRLTSDGQFVLYSIGWNERDDGGVVGLTRGGTVDSSKGDWVWRYPEK